jgi:signal transduction histidine kinase
MRTPSTGVLIGLAGAGLGLCAITGWVTATGSASGDVPLEVTARVLMIGLPIAIGLFAWSQPASARFGRNLTLTGFVYFLAMLSSSADEVVHSVGRVAGWLVEVWITYLVLSFPSGRLTLRRDRAIIALGVLLVGFLYLPTAPLTDGYPTPSQWESCVSDCPANAFQVTASEPAFVEAWVRPLREVLTIALFVAATVSLALRVRSASPLVRMATGPVVAIAAARLLILAIVLVLRAIDPVGTPAQIGAWLVGLCIPLITLAFLAGLLRWRLFIGASLARLAHDTGAYTTLDQLRGGLADAFRDPGLQILERTPSAAGPGRAITAIHEHGQPVAAIVHDEALGEERAFEDAAAARVLATLESQRLVREIEESRARIAATADEERRRLERDLHDGAQQRLVALRMRLGLANELLKRDHERGAELVRQLGPEAEAALEEMRLLARGVYPAPLADHGLAEALRSAARRSPLPAVVIAEDGRRYPQPLEATGYFCCLEALQNAAKHAAGATRVTVSIAEREGNLEVEVVDDGSGFDPARIERGAGLTNLEDRARAVGGDAIVESGAGRGTRMLIRLPLG